ncbi:MAG: PilZ domain-containing protein [Pseudomonadota bacterium]
MERREDSRIKITGDSFVTRHHSQEKFGRIIDISRGGLAFYYLDTTSIPGNFSIELGIWLQEQDLFLPDVIANTVSDREVAYKNPYKQIPLRRRGVRFCNLSFDQTEQLHFACRKILPDNPYEQKQNHFHPL